jgi:hypothetical protein
MKRIQTMRTNIHTLALCLALLAPALSSAQDLVVPQQYSTEEDSTAQRILRMLAGAEDGQRSYDPKGGANLFDQIPAWDGAALKVCCSAVTGAEWTKARCDTDTPVPPRTNRC